MLKHLSIRIKIAIGFIVVALLSLTLTITNNFFQSRSQNAYEKKEAMLKIEQIMFQKQQFFQSTLINSRTEKFQKTSIIDLMDIYSNNDIKMNEEIKFISNQEKPQNTTHINLTEINELEQNNRNLFRIIAEEQISIGHASFGLIGQFRDEIHSIEGSDFLSNEEYLGLRRHEKDYLLRKNLKYAKKLNEKIDQIKRKKSVEWKNTDEFLALSQYQQNFNRVVYSMERIGDNRYGLIHELNSNYKSTDQIIALKSAQVSAEFKFINETNSTFQTICTVIIFIAITLAIIILSRTIGLPIKKFDQTIKEFISSDYKTYSQLNLNSRNDEIGSLMRNFQTMEKDIVHRFNNFINKSNERQERLTRSNEKIRIQKFLLQEQRNKLEESNKDHLDSLYYAQKLQKAILPSSEKMNKLLGPHGVIFNPKDIISGDFYWVEEKKENIYFAVGDCTGHGIPGAFLSVLCMSFLNAAIFDHNISATNEILNFVSSKVGKALNQQGHHSDIKDGMDIAICKYNKTNGTFSFSGAQRPLILIRADEIIEIKPDKFPIGLVTDQFCQAFTKHDINLENGDRIFLYSDGYHDQFGGDKNKKLKSRKMKELILESSQVSIKDQLVFLNQFMINWKGYNNAQIDDICVLGIKYEGKSVLKNNVISLSARENPKKQSGQQTIYT